MSAFRVAIVGAGGMGKTHARHWKSVENTEIVGVMDLDRDAAKILTPESAFDDWNALLRDTKPDVIDICTPTPTHCEYIEKACAEGKAIFCEKPLGRTMDECERAVKAIEKSNVPFMAGHVVRFFPEFAAAKKLTESGGVGIPAAVRTSRTGSQPRGVNNWYLDEAQSGGVTLDLIVHDFDWLRWTFGPVKRVYAKGGPDYALVTLRFDGDLMAHVTGSWAHSDGFRTTFEIAGDAGLIEHDSRQTPSVFSPSPESPLSPDDDPYFLELAAFVQSLQNSQTPPITIDDAYEAARIALAALESMTTGRVVEL